MTPPRYTDADLRRRERIMAMVDTLSADQLHAACKDRSLPVTGTKVELATRLVDARFTLTDVLARRLTLPPP